MNHWLITKTKWHYILLHSSLQCTLQHIPENQSLVIIHGNASHPSWSPALTLHWSHTILCIGSPISATTSSPIMVTSQLPQCIPNQSPLFQQPSMTMMIPHWQHSTIGDHLTAAATQFLSQLPSIDMIPSTLLTCWEYLQSKQPHPHSTFPSSSTSKYLATTNHVYWLQNNRHKPNGPCIGQPLHNQSATPVGPIWAPAHFLLLCNQQHPLPYQGQLLLMQLLNDSSMYSTNAWDSPGVTNTFYSLHTGITTGTWSNRTKLFRCSLQYKKLSRSSWRLFHGTTSPSLQTACHLPTFSYHQHDVFNMQRSTDIFLQNSALLCHLDLPGNTIANECMWNHMMLAMYV